MTVLGRGLVFQPILVTQTCTYNSKNITLTLQIFHQKRKKIFFKKNITTPSPPKKTHNNNNKRGHNTSECFDMPLKLGKRERQRQRQRDRERERERQRRDGEGGGGHLFVTNTGVLRQRLHATRRLRVVFTLWTLRYHAKFPTEKQCYVGGRIGRTPL